MNFKKAFTMIELLIVMLIIGMLFYYVKGAFTYKNVEKMKFDTCYIHTYAKITKFMDNALYQKRIYSGNVLNDVDLYTMHFDITNQKLDLIYSGANKVIKTINYKGATSTGSDSINDCYTSNYHALLSGKDLKIDIKPGLQSDITEKTLKMEVGGTEVSNSTTGNMYMYYCQGNYCLEKYRMTFIPSTYLLVSSFCVRVDLNTGKCQEWSK